MNNIRLLIGTPTHKGSFGTDMSRVGYPFLTGNVAEGPKSECSVPTAYMGTGRDTGELLMIYTRAAMTFGFIFLRMSASKGAKSWRSGQSILGLRN